MNDNKDIKTAAALLGSIGGRRNTEAQNKARAENGRKGGRPKKIKIVVDKLERLG